MSNPTTEPGLILIGGGGHAIVVGEAARIVGDGGGIDPDGLLDDHENPEASRPPHGMVRLGPISSLAEQTKGAASWILALGDLPTRRQVLDSLDADAMRALGAPVIHPNADVSPTASIGRGVFIGPGAIVHARTVIGAHAIINSGAIVEHECRVGENVHVGPGAILAGEVKVGKDTLIALGSRVLPGVSIGERAIIAAGAVVIRDVADGVTVMGVPARPGRAD